MNRISWAALLACALVLGIVLLTPSYWHWTYYQRLVRAVPLGSTQSEYEKALQAGLLGTSNWGERSSWIPLSLPGFSYNIEAGVLLKDGKVAGYHLYWFVLFQGHLYSMDPPPPIPVW